MENKTALELLTADIAEYSLNDLIKMVPDIYELVRDPVELAQAKALFLSRAADLGDKKIIQSIMTSVEKQQKLNQKKEMIRKNSLSTAAYLELDRNGLPAETIDNFYNIMLGDEEYRRIRFNVVSGRAELPKRLTSGEEIIDAWDDTDDAISQHYIEEAYHLYAPQKHQAALRMLFKAREYNPIQNVVEAIQWDGENRIENFLHEWMKVEDTPYSREVSRLIFAGGINRLYRPGCKFDDVVVLVGEAQGEGKSTIVEWLAINPQWYGVVKHIEGKDALEEISGKWVCEISELSAFKRADDVEAIKAFVTIDRDRYRRPYDRYPQDYPRRCIFIGTTNQSQFLVDKTGNRRFYPVSVYQNGYVLRDHEEECREYIAQCWAEARERFKKNDMLPFAKKELADEYKKYQDAAMEDDWRVGVIEEYLRKFGANEKVCCLQIFRECISPDPEKGSPKKAESNAIGQIMSKQIGWKRINSTSKFGKYGKQKGWICVQPSGSGLAEDPEDLPF